MVTISFFNRTFIRMKGRVGAVEYLRLQFRQAAQVRQCLQCVPRCDLRCGNGAIHAFLASSTEPFAPTP